MSLPNPPAILKNFFAGYPLVLWNYLTKLVAAIGPTVNAILQGGNSFGAPLSIGTNDVNKVSIGADTATIPAVSIVLDPTVSPPTIAFKTGASVVDEWFFSGGTSFIGPHSPAGVFRGVYDPVRPTGLVTAQGSVANSGSLNLIVEGAHALDAVVTGGALAIGFFGVGTVARPTVTGSRSANTAMTYSIVQALASLGLVIDGTGP